MRKIIFIPIIAGTLLALVSALILTASPTPDPSAIAFYKGTIDKYIATSNLKERLFKDSRFENIRKYATLAKKKAIFFSTNKERLVAEMIQAKMAKKHHHIEAFLNRRFLESVLKENRVAHRTATNQQ